MSKSNGLSFDALAARMVVLTALFDEYDQRQVDLKRASKANRDLVSAYFEAQRFAEEVNDQRYATEAMLRTMPAKSLADAGLHVAMAEVLAHNIYDCTEDHHQEHDALIIQRLLKSALAAMANNGVEMHAICEAYYPRFPQRP